MYWEKSASSGVSHDPEASIGPKREKIKAAAKSAQAQAGTENFLKGSVKNEGFCRGGAGRQTRMAANPGTAKPKKKIKIFKVGEKQPKVKSEFEKTNRGKNHQGL